MKKIITGLVFTLFTVLAYAQPVNDDPCSATVITVAESGDPVVPALIPTTGATYTNFAFPTGSCVIANMVDTWYKFVSPGPSIYLYFYFSTTSHIQIEIFSAATCNSGYTRVYCSNYLPHSVSHLIPNLVAGTTYYVRVGNSFNGAISIGASAYTGMPAANARTGINTNSPTNHFDVAGNVSLRNNVGIGERNPQFPLTFSSILGDKLSLYGNNPTGTHYGFGIQSNLLQIHGDGGISNIAFGFGSSSSFNERARIINTGEYGLDLTGRIRIRNGTQSSGVWFMNSTNTANSAFVGLPSNTQVGFFGSGNNQWGLTMNTTTSNVGIGLNGADPVKPLSFPAVLGEKILLYPGGTGEVGIGVYGNELRLHSDNPGAKVSFGTQTNAGVFTENAKAERNGSFAFSIFGSLWVNGTTYASDERFKKNISPIASPLSKLMRLNGVEYEMKTEDFSNQYFTKGRQIGLLAQNVEQVIPEAVQEMNGYKGVDYAKLVPLLIESIKELQQKIVELENRLNSPRQ